MNWINGKKTLIAAIIMTLSVILSEVVVGIWGYDPSWMADVIKTLNWIGMLLGSAGIGHKFIKAKKKLPSDA